MIPANLLSTYATLHHDLEELRARVDPILIQIATEKKGLYTSRIKTPESIFEKMALGRYAKPFLEMEDMFAATIILSRAPDDSARLSLESALSDRFTLLETRSNRTKQPTQFIYDDLHYILKFSDSPILLNKRLLIWAFELQVKSYLQHGWSMATHDSIYKSGQESWRASRVAAQTKALVELIEAALATGEALLPESADRNFTPIDDRVLIAGLLSEWWPHELPKDRRRLSLFVQEFLSLAGVKIIQLSQMLMSERGKELAQRYSLSIHQAFLILLIEMYGERLISRLQSKRDRFLLITESMEQISESCKSVPEEIRVLISRV